MAVKSGGLKLTAACPDGNVVVEGSYTSVLVNNLNTYALEITEGVVVKVV